MTAPTRLYTEEVTAKLSLVKAVTFEFVWKQ